ncbi:MAG: hypothetical protein AAB425_05370 [Bdellovibrionota bacterium]
MSLRAAKLYSAVLMFNLSTMISAYAEECKALRLDQSPHSMAAVKLKDQVDTSACAAYATVDMLEAWYRTIPSTGAPPPMFSPI